MPMPVDWYDDKHTIIKVTIQKDSTWDEYYEVIEWIAKEVTNVDHRVDIIFHDDVGMPKGNPISHLKWGSKKITSLPNSGHTIIAGTQGISNTFVYMIMGIVAKTFVGYSLPVDPEKRLLFMPSLEEAVSFLHSAIESKAST